MNLIIQKILFKRNGSVLLNVYVTKPAIYQYQTTVNVDIIICCNPLPTVKEVTCVVVWVKCSANSKSFRGTAQVY